MSAATGDLEQRASQLAQAKRQLAAAQEERGELERRLQAATRNLREANDRAAELEARAGDQQRKAAAELQRVKAELDGANTQLKLQTNNVAQLENELRNLRQAQEQLRLAVPQPTSATRALSLGAEPEVLSRAAPAVDPALEELCQRLQQENERLVTHLRQLEMERDVIEAEAKAAADEVERLKALVARPPAGADEAALRAMLQEAESDARRFHQRVVELTEENNQLRAELARLRGLSTPAPATPPVRKAVSSARPLVLTSLKPLTPEVATKAPASAHRHRSVRRRIIQSDSDNESDAGRGPPAVPAPRRAGGPVHYFPVEIVPSRAATSLGLEGRSVLALAPDELALLHHKTRQPLHAWPLAHIRRFGQDEGVFSFEVGQIDNEPGVLFMATKRFNEIFDRVTHATNSLP